MTRQRTPQTPIGSIGNCVIQPCTGNFRFRSVHRHQSVSSDHCCGGSAAQPMLGARRSTLVTTSTRRRGAGNRGRFAKKFGPVLGGCQHICHVPCDDRHELGACGAGGSGAGIRFSKAGICGAGAPKRAGELRTKPPRSDPWPKPAPRAKPGVDPTTQATANTAAKTRFMIAFLVLLCLPSCSQSNHPTGNDFIAVASIRPALRSSTRLFVRWGERTHPGAGLVHLGGPTSGWIIIRMRGDCPRPPVNHARAAASCSLGSAARRCEALALRGTNYYPCVR
jgi:hypothetical protein